MFLFSATDLVGQWVIRRFYDEYIYTPKTWNLNVTFNLCSFKVKKGGVRLAKACAMIEVVYFFL